MFKKSILGLCKITILSTVAFATTGPALAYDPVAATEAANGPACEGARPFYWELGDSSGDPIVSGQVGGNKFDRDTDISIGSASKWLLAAYVVERFNGLPNGPEGEKIASALKMLDGYTSFNPLLCLATAKVSSCHTVGSNDLVEEDRIGYFNYGGGHGQAIATDPALLGLGDMYRYQLMNEVNSYLALGDSFSYKTPGVSGGMTASARDYADFLQRILDGSLVMSQYLGYSPVQTVCDKCSSFYGVANLHYSLHHWIEDNDQAGALTDGTPVPVGDGAYSSLGIFGFYPWISADKNYYGIVSRKGYPSPSYTCGRAIRDAFLN